MDQRRLSDFIAFKPEVRTLLPVPITHIRRDDDSVYWS